MKPKHPTQIWLLADLQEKEQGSKLRVQITRYLPNITCLNATPTEPRHSYFVDTCIWSVGVKFHKMYLITPQLLPAQGMGQCFMLISGHI